ncbi:hypothetical protein [Gandjariella thermophila]|uniref:Uncharacterized protein n=1 Tax=Gandjariella thermophila TaxID=1931992 RepID=A0A4D4JCE4_9PSEU|nr:hypothetical protein [Gandjariella thermophila]GDY32328.1 hypothetical protein GTS_39610 [Gandjariella thermophila]
MTRPARVALDLRPIGGTSGAVGEVLGGVARDAFGSYQPVWLAAGVLCAVAALLALPGGAQQDR